MSGANVFPMTYASDLAALVDAYAEAKEAEAAAVERAKDLRDSLLAAHAEHLDSGDTGNVINGERSSIVVTRTTSWRLDSTRLKKEYPEVYAAYAKESSSTRLTVTPR